MMPPNAPPNPIASIPSPDDVRKAIAARTAEVLVLKRLLRASESKSQLCPPATCTERADAPKG